jgi:hypothetical protein
LGEKSDASAEARIFRGFSNGNGNGDGSSDSLGIGIEQRSTAPRIEVGAAGADKNNKTIYSVTGQARSRTPGRIRSK